MIFSGLFLGGRSGTLPEVLYGQNLIMGQLLDSFLNLKKDFKVNIAPIKDLLEQKIAVDSLMYN
jgi:hypothetical protein